MPALAAQYPLFSKLTPVADQQGRVGDGPVIGQALSFDTATVNRYLNLPQVKALLPRDLKLMWGIKPVDVQETVFQLYAIKANTRDGKAPLDGGAVVSAHRGICAARIERRGFDDDECRRSPHMGPHDGR